MKVDPSPFNEVKLELGIILTVGAFLLLIQGRVVDSLVLQFLLLTCYGLLGMGWIMLRVRQVLRKLHHEREPQQHESQ
jgi:hypothetical protein